MEHHTENRKKKYSRMVIEEAFLSLLQEYPLEKISVTKICQRADVNRSTFYAHYMDVYDLANKVSDSFLEQIFSRIVSSLGEPTGQGGNEATHRIILKALDTALQHKELCRLLLTLSPYTDFTRRLLHTSLEWCSRRYDLYSDGSNDDHRIGYVMMLGGVIVLWLHWIEEDFATEPKRLAAQIEKYIDANITLIWHQ